MADKRRTVNKWKIRFGVHGLGSHVELNGVDITDTIYSITVESSADSKTTVIVEYTHNEVEVEADEEAE